MGFVDSIKAGFSKYVDFGTRSSRSEYWYWTLFVVLATLALTLIDIAILGVDHIAGIADLFGLATLVPGIAVGVRRLHDYDKSGWWMLLCFVPIIGWIVLIYWFVQKGTDGNNRFGADPLT